MFKDVVRSLTDGLGSAATFAAAVAALLAWAAAGVFHFGFGSEYQAAMNSVTGAITFCMVFLVQASQNRDTKAIQAKLDELIAATEGARNTMMHIENKDDARIDAERKDPTRDEEE